MPDTTTVATDEQQGLLLSSLHEYLQRLTVLADRYDGSTAGATELEQVLAGYSRLVTDASTEEVFAEVQRETSADLVTGLRDQSARCAAITEKHRALRLLDGHVTSAGYFDDVEACIEQELGTFPPTRDSKVLLVGSGAFPMTPLHLARSTGARVVAVDIDAEAVGLGRQVVDVLGRDLPISLEHVPVEALPFTAEATHVIFSSTISVKYDLLDLLHPLARDDVIVAMRFGDGLKSLFNYPQQEVDPRKWTPIETVRRPGHVYDVALYTKASLRSGDGGKHR